MLKDISKGINIGLGFILVIGLMFGVVFAVGFHTPNEILPGTFNGDFQFDNIGGRQIIVGNNNGWLDLSSHAGGVGLVAGNIHTFYNGTDIQYRYSITHGSIGGIGFATNYPSWNKAAIITSGTNSAIANQNFTPNSIMTFQNDGLVGIGTANPLGKLHVNGTIRTEQICDQAGGNCKTISDGWSAGGSIPTGSTMAYFTASCPAGWLKTDGSAISRVTYSDLFGELGVMYGSGDGSTTFNLPDTRGYFLRSFADSSTMDPDRASRTDRGDGTTGDNVGTKQEDGTAPNGILLETSNWNQGTGSYMRQRIFGDSGARSVSDYWGNGVTIMTSSSLGIRFAGDSETRPRNINVLYCIKY